MPTSPLWRPDIHADRLPFLAARGRITAAARRHFSSQGFTEVETSALQVSPANETHLHGFATDLVEPDGASGRRYLRTSPEFACKKLLAAGEERIFEIARVFRNRERGPLHHPEFTLLEWYRARTRYEALFEDCAALLALATKATARERLVYRERTCDPSAPAERLTVAEAFARHAGIDLLATLEEGRGDRDGLEVAANAAGVGTAADDTWSDIFSRVVVARIEPRLGLGRPTILYEYPAPEAALARLKPGDPRLAERFEVYACGVELANGFGELTDAAEQRRRFEADMVEKSRLHGERYPVDEDFLAALASMPAASGVALGLDRLVMLATGASRIEQVLWDPVAAIAASD